MDRSFVKIMTSNVQGLFDPTSFFSLDLNQKVDAENRVREAIFQLAELPEANCPDILCLNEILFGGAADICRELLVERYPYWVWAAYSDTGDALVAAGIGGSVGFAIGSVPGAAIGAGLGALFEGLYTDNGGSAGAMIFSRARLIEFPEISRSERPKIRHFTEKTDNDEPFSVLVGEYTDTTGDDAFARKGFLVVKARTQTGEPFYVVSTHLQAGYDKDDECKNDIHFNDENCKQHADVRRSEIDEIVRALRDSGLDDDAWNRTIITGDMNVRGEPDRRTFVAPDVSEWASVFDPDIEDIFPDEEGFQSSFDGWHQHTGLGGRYATLANSVDPGFTNFNVIDDETAQKVHRGQRLDYIIYPRSFDMVPHVMLNRFRGVADHRSVEAHFGMVCNWCQPSTADDVTRHRASDGNKNLVWLVHPHEPYDRKDRYDWSFIPTKSRFGTRGPWGGKWLNLRRVGDSPGTYAVSGGYELEQDGLIEPGELKVFLADDLTLPTDTSRKIQNRIHSVETSGMGLKYRNSVEEVHILGGPVYLCMRTPMGKTAFMSVRRLTGDTPEDALGLAPWLDEQTPWPTAGASSGATATTRWYRIDVTKHSGGHAYPCSIRIDNPDGAKLKCQLLNETTSPMDPVLGDNGQPVAVTSSEATLSIDWSTGGGEVIYLRVDWDAGVPIKQATVCYRPELTGFGNGRSDATQLLFACIKETSGSGSDEIRIRIFADDKLWQIFNWDDADSGEKLASTVYEAMLAKPVWFHKELTIEFTEKGDHSGRQYGRRTLTRLEDASPRSINETVKIDDGDGVYSFGGALFRDFRPRKNVV